jgi:hypothetical protein
MSSARDVLLTVRNLIGEGGGADTIYAKVIPVIDEFLRETNPHRKVMFRKVGCADWYDGYPDLEDSGGPYETRLLFTQPNELEEENKNLLRANRMCVNAFDELKQDYDKAVLDAARWNYIAKYLTTKDLMIICNRIPGDAEDELRVEEELDRIRLK